MRIDDAQKAPTGGILGRLRARSLRRRARRPLDVAIFHLKQPIRRIRRGLVILTLVVIAAVLGYRFIGGYDWIESFWMVVITIASVGYGERSQTAPAIQLLTIGVVIVGMSAAAYTFGGFIQMVLEGELEQWMGHRRLTRGIEELNHHVIICGMGRIGQILAADLHRQNRPFVIIDSDAQRYEDARSRKYLCFQGDATEDAVLLAAGIERAQSLVTVLPSDASNVFITLTARNLNPKLRIVARAEHRTTEQKLVQAGANRVVMPAMIGAHQMERIITRPSTAELWEFVSSSGYREFSLDEVVVDDHGRLLGTTVQATEAHRRHRLLVVAIKKPNGEMVFNPGADYVFQTGDVALVMGHQDAIERFRKENKPDPQ